MKFKLPLIVLAGLVIVQTSIAVSISISSQLYQHHAIPPSSSTSTSRVQSKLRGGRIPAIVKNPQNAKNANNPSRKLAIRPALPYRFDNSYHNDYRRPDDNNDKEKEEDVPQPIAPPSLSREIMDPPKHHENPYPWLVSIQHLDDRNSVCNGVLISDRVVLTSAHCINQYGRTRDASLLTVTMQHQYSYHQFRVTSVITHPYYVDDRRSPMFMRNDLACLILEDPIEIDFDLPKLISEPTAESDIRNANLISARWVHKYPIISNLNTTPDSWKLQITHPKLQPFTSHPHPHSHITTSWNMEDEDTFCVSPTSHDSIRANTHNIPTMELNGPVFGYDNKHGNVVLYGIPSYFINVCDVYTSVERYADWIDSVVCAHE